MSRISLLLLGQCLAVWCLAPRDVTAQQPVLADELARFDTWLGSSEKGERWRRYLGLTEFQEELEKPDIEIQKLQAFLERSSTTTTGSSHPRIRLLRQVVARQLVEQSHPGGNEASNDTRVAAWDYQPITEPQLKRSLQDLVTHLNQLDGLLTRMGMEKREKWHAYLGWPELMKLVKKSPPVEPRSLLQSFRPFYSGVPGLERLEFRRSRAAFETYLSQTVLANLEQPTQFYRQQMEELATAIDAYLGEPTDENAEDIGRRLKWLAELEQKSNMEDRIRNRLSHPNVFFTIDEQLVNQAYMREVNRPVRIRDRILGTRISGSGRTNGTLSYDIAQSSDAAVVDVMLTGVTSSSTIGRNGPARLRTIGSTQMNGLKRIIVTGEGVRAESTRANCRTRTRIQSIWSASRIGRGFVEKIARRRAREQRGQANQIASRRAERRLARQMDEEARTMLATANQRFEEGFLELERLGLKASQLQFTSTDQQASMRVAIDGSAQLAAPSAPPATDRRGDITMSMHSSAGRNVMGGILSGIVLTDERLVDILKQRDVEIPNELEIGPTKTPWSIKFAQQMPIRLTFRDGRVEVALRGDRVTRGAQALDLPVEVKAAYRLAATGEGVTASREGDVQVRFLGSRTQRISPFRLTTFRTLMRRKFGALFKEEAEFAGARLPDVLRKLGPLQVASIRSDRNWMTITWQRKASELTTAARDQWTVGSR